MRYLNSYQIMVALFLVLVIASIMLLIYNMVFAGRLARTAHIAREGMELLEGMARVKTRMKCRPRSSDFLQCTSKSERMLSHCGFQVRSDDDALYSGLEPDQEALKLASAFSVIGSGDYVPIFDFPKSAVLKSSIATSNYLEPRSLSLHFQTSSEFYKAISIEKHLIGITNVHANDKFGWRTIPDDKLSEGDLTSVGFRQMSLAANVYREHYFDLLQQTSDSKQQLCSNKSIYLAATNSKSSVQSAASFLAMLCKSSSNSTLRAGLESIEIDTAYTSNSAVKLCPRAVKYSKLQEMALKNRQMEDPEKVMRLYFGVNLTNSQLDSIMLTSLSEYCHGRSPLCSTKTPKNKNDSPCLKVAHLENALWNRDQQYKSQVRGKSGGHDATKLAAYPALEKISTEFAANLKGQSNVRLLFLFDHSDLAQQMLLALDGESLLARLPTYANRLAFQLWVPRNDTGISFVRIINRGIDITQNIPGCKEEMLDGMNAMRMCSFQTFRRQIDKLISPHSTYEEACN